jgi:hypothetical protein
MSQALIGPIADSAPSAKPRDSGANHGSADPLPPSPMRLNAFSHNVRQPPLVHGSPKVFLKVALCGLSGRPESSAVLMPLNWR